MKGWGKWEIPEKNPPTSGIVWHDSHIHINDNNIPVVEITIGRLSIEDPRVRVIRQYRRGKKKIFTVRKVATRLEGGNGGSSLQAKGSQVMERHVVQYLVAVMNDTNWLQELLEDLVQAVDKGKQDSDAKKKKKKKKDELLDNKWVVDWIDNFLMGRKCSKKSGGVLIGGRWGYIRDSAGVIFKRKKQVQKLVSEGRTLGMLGRALKLNSKEVEKVEGIVNDEGVVLSKRQAKSGEVGQGVQDGEWSMRTGIVGETGDHRENPLTKGIVRHNSHMQKSGNLAGDVLLCKWTAEAERLVRSPPTKATGFNPWPVHPIFTSGNHAGQWCWSVGFLGDLPFPQPLHSITLIGSQDLTSGVHENVVIPTTGDKNLSGAPAADKSAPVLEGYMSSPMVQRDAGARQPQGLRAHLQSVEDSLLSSAALTGFRLLQQPEAGLEPPPPADSLQKAASTISFSLLPRDSSPHLVNPTPSEAMRETCLTTESLLNQIIAESQSSTLNTSESESHQIDYNIVLSLDHETLLKHLLGWCKSDEESDFEETPIQPTLIRAPPTNTDTQSPSNRSSRILRVRHPRTEVLPNFCIITLASGWTIRVQIPPKAIPHNLPEQPTANFIPARQPTRPRWINPLIHHVSGQLASRLLTYLVIWRVRLPGRDSLTLRITLGFDSPLPLKEAPGKFQVLKTMRGHAGYTLHSGGGMVKSCSYLVPRWCQGLVGSCWSVQSDVVQKICQCDAVSFQQCKGKSGMPDVTV
ncbi:hypothetical protein PR048_009350 [Dryococelus australis]|uniref:Uncharacterized protein n=1 Tax=Dryococelus australis TaxID=614101 RepID=A0ABQ9HZM8_9NEOP|nr:hypothetical protein PR048_009350 [Dryococelus australis]